MTQETKLTLKLKGERKKRLNVEVQEMKNPQTQYTYQVTEQDINEAYASTLNPVSFVPVEILERKP